MYGRRIHGIIAVCVLGLTILAVGAPARADDLITVNQGWSAKRKAIWYSLSQGSRLIPLSWLLALEQPGSDQPFLDPAHIEKFRYLPNSTPAKTGLPIGFAIDSQDDTRFYNTQLRWKESQGATEKWVGMTCSACHTNEITYQGKRIRIEGAPALADFQSFMETLNKALVETKNNPDKAKRFSHNVLKDDDTAANRAKLDEALSQLIAWQLKIEKANATALRYGFGRVDAFGHIFNKVAFVIAEGDQTFNASNAPVSYPFMWNVPQHDKVQWNGIVSNQRILGGYDIGALGRNIGEVTGVFADVKFNKHELGGPGIVSSANAVNLNLLEEQLMRLRPPLWPTGVLGALDQGKRDRGREIFRDEQRMVDGHVIPSCASCHKPLARSNLTAQIRAKMTPLRSIGTDIWMACNALTHKAKTGVLNNTLYAYLPFIDPDSRMYGEEAALADLLRTTVVGTIWAKKRDIAGDIFRNFQGRTPGGLGSSEQITPSTLPANERPLRTQAKQDLRNQCLNGTDPLLAYKGRPLSGIWATAPYLHNGSVPTLYDLLLPPKDRPPSFPVGTREFDPIRVGFVTRGPDGKIAQPSTENSFVLRTRDDAGRVIDGNSNAGHDYGNAALTDTERWELVEYLKGL